MDKKDDQWWVKFIFSQNFTGRIVWVARFDKVKICKKCTQGKLWCAFRRGRKSWNAFVNKVLLFWLSNYVQYDKTRLFKSSYQSDARNIGMHILYIVL